MEKSFPAVTSMVVTLNQIGDFRFLAQNNQSPFYIGSCHMINWKNSDSDHDQLLSYYSQFNDRIHLIKDVTEIDRHGLPVIPSVSDTTRDSSVTIQNMFCGSLNILPNLLEDKSLAPQNPYRFCQWTRFNKDVCWYTWMSLQITFDVQEPSMFAIMFVGALENNWKNG